MADYPIDIRCGIYKIPILKHDPIKKVRLPIENKKCMRCGNEISEKSKRFCSQKCSQLASRIAERPSWDILKEDLKTMPMIKIGDKYGVSDNAVRKWIVAYTKEKII